MGLTADRSSTCCTTCCETTSEASSTTGSLLRRESAACCVNPTGRLAEARNINIDSSTSPSLPTTRPAPDPHWSRALLPQLALLWFVGLVAAMARRPVRVLDDDVGLWAATDGAPKGDSSARLTLTGDAAIIATRALEQSTHRPAAAFFVPGTPAPQGSKRPFRNKYTGKIRMAEQSKRAPNWRRDIHEAAETAMQGRQPLDGPLEVELRFVFSRPTTHLSARGGLKPSAPVHLSNKADVDKLCRGVLDALCIRTGGRVIVDDRMVTRLVATKEYGERPGCWVAVWRLA
jgi:Holliday junction resolvase RusA-like endonuclease